MECRHVDATATLRLGGDGRGGGAGSVRVVSVQHAMEEAVAAAVVRMATLGNRPYVRSDEEGARQPAGARGAPPRWTAATQRVRAARNAWGNARRAHPAELERAIHSERSRCLRGDGPAHGCEELELRAERRREAAARLTHRRFGPVICAAAGAAASRNASAS